MRIAYLLLLPAATGFSPSTFVRPGVSNGLHTPVTGFTTNLISSTRSGSSSLSLLPSQLLADAVAATDAVTEVSKDSGNGKGATRFRIVNDQP